MEGDGVYVISRETPLARFVLKVLRDRETGYEEFRRYMRIAGAILAVYALREAEWRETRVVTPLNAEAVELEPAAPLYVVGVLGASIPLVEGFLSIAPWARIGLVAAKRIEEEGGPVRTEVYYVRLPSRVDGPAFVVDPMLATGGTVEAAVRILKERGAPRVTVASVIAAVPGIERLRRSHPDVKIYTLAVDPELDSRYFIVPGLGDAGDRALGVEA